MRARQWVGRAAVLAMAVFACAAMLSVFGVAAAFGNGVWVDGSLPTTSTWIADSYVLSMARGPNETTFVSGYFDHLGPYTGSVALLDGPDAVVQPFPRITGETDAIAPDGEGGFYVAGSFWVVDNTERRNIIHTLPDGTVDTDFISSAIDGSIYDVELLGDELWVGGSFWIEGTRTNLVVLDALTGARLPYNVATDDTVYALMRDGDTMWVGGSFLGIAGESAWRLARFDGATHGLLPAPQVDASWGYVNELARSDDTLYIGGYFTGVNGWTRPNLAAVDVETNAVSDWTPSPDGAVMALELAGDRLYVGGQFTTIDAVGRGRLAAYDLTDPDAPTPIDLGWSSNAQVNSLAYSMGTLYIGGSFNQMTGSGDPQDRQYAAALDVSDGSVGLLDWNPQPFGDVYHIQIGADGILIAGSYRSGRGYDHEMIACLDENGVPTDWQFDVLTEYWSVDEIVCDGSRLFAAGRFPSPDSDPTLIEIDTGTGAVLDAAAIGEAGDEQLTLAQMADWLYFAIDQRVYKVTKDDLAIDDGFSCTTNLNADAIAPTGDGVYIGGEFESVNGEDRTGAAKVDPVTGELLPWYPKLSAMFINNPDRPRIYDIEPTPQGVYIAGRFDTIGEDPLVKQANVARLDPVTAEVDLQFAPYVSWSVRKLETNGVDIILGGDFRRVNSSNTLGVVELDQYGQIVPRTDGFIAPYSGVYDLLMNNGQLYVGGDYYSVLVGPAGEELEIGRSYLASWPNATPSVPPRTLDFSAEASGTSAIHLEWSQPVLRAYESVRIFRSTTGVALTPAGGAGQHFVIEATGLDSYDDDDGIVPGVLYIYTAFPMNADGTWGPSSVAWAEIGGAGGLTPTAVTCSANHTTANYLEPVTVTGELRADGVLTAGKTLELWGSTNTGGSWTKLATATDAGGGRYRASFKPRCNTYVEWRFAGDTELQPCISTGVELVKARANLSRPYVDPDTPSAWDAFWVKGKLYPKHSFRTNVRIEVFKRVGGKWVWVKSPVYHVATGATSYKCRMVLGRGHYRIVAKHIDRNHDTTRSTPKYFDVKR